MVALPVGSRGADDGDAASSCAPVGVSRCDGSCEYRLNRRGPTTSGFGAYAAYIAYPVKAISVDLCVIGYTVLSIVGSRGKRAGGIERYAQPTMCAW